MWIKVSILLAVCKVRADVNKSFFIKPYPKNNLYQYFYLCFAIFKPLPVALKDGRRLIEFSIIFWVKHAKCVVSKCAALQTNATKLPIFQVPFKKSNRANGQNSFLRNKRLYLS